MHSLKRMAIVATIWLLATNAMAQPPATGRLLVSTQSLAGSEFSESVLLLLHHDDDGSLALLLNRPTWVQPAEAFPAAAALENYRGTLYRGGPVAPTQLLVLVQQEAPIQVEATHVVGDVYVTAGVEILDEPAYARAPDSRLRLYAGHAAWAPGQLEAEIQDGSWRVLFGREEIIFDPRPIDLWRQVADIDDGELSARTVDRAR